MTNARTNPIRTTPADRRDTPRERTLLFFADPMCSWCWGFAPVLDALIAAIEGRARLEIVMGGLRPGTEAPWDEKMRADIAGHWRHVHDLTGQPFDFSRFDDHAFIYDTLPACRAVATARALAPERAPAYFGAVQKAFYGEGRDVTKATVLADIAAQTDYAYEAFLGALNAPQSLRQTMEDFAKTRAYGVGGFPTLVCEKGANHQALCVGYRPFAALSAPLEAWLES